MGKILTREHLAKYREKLEEGIADYMSMSASERNANAVRAMLEGWLLLDSAEPKLCGYAELDRETVEAWMRGMVNSDGSTGPRWSMEQTASLAEELGISRETISPWCWWAAVNMMWSDYAEVASKFSVSSPDFFAELARAFLLDPDGPGPKAKLAGYYCGVVQGR